MPTYVLEPGRPVRLPARAFKAHLTPSAGLPALKLTARGALRPYPLTTTQWLVQYVPDGAAEPADESGDEMATLAVATTDGGALPPGAQLALSLEIDGGPGFDPDFVRLPAQDLAGTAGRDLLTVRIDSRTMEISLAVEHREFKQVSAPASAAVALTRSHLARLNEVPRHGITVLVDDSASMAPCFASGQIGEVVEAFYGICEALDTSDAFNVTLGASPVPHGTEPRPSIEAAWAAEGNRTGFAAAGMAARSPSAVTFVVTDAPPADLAALEARHATGDLRHLVLLMDDAAFAACGVSTNLPVTLWTPGAAADGDLIRSLLNNAVSTSAARHERVGS